ncbi:MAG: NAD(P)/FAD-dependent oxidoreductase [Acidimicrobiia bacterium]
MSDRRADVCVVGAGLAGLSCARFLLRAGIDTVVIEASDGVGGRVRSDLVDGFVLDRGFQVLLTQYPEPHHQLRIKDLDLCRFDPGALVQIGRRRHRVGDPLRAPGTILSSALAPIGTPADKLRLARLFLDVRRASPRDLLRRPGRSTLDELVARGFSTRAIDRFWRPLFAGIQLDPDLEVSNRRFLVILAMLAEGSAAVPTAGMGAITAQLAEGIPDEMLWLAAPVREITDAGVALADGRRIDATSVVVATDGPAAARLVGLPDPGSRPVSAIQLAADEAPFDDRLVVLDGSRTGPATNLAVMTNVAPSYAPAGRAQISVEVPGPLVDTDAELLSAVRRQLRGWFGSAVDRWEHLRTVRIPHGHPDQRAGFSVKRPVRLGGGRYVCGDHRDTASIQGALYSGRRTASAVIADLRPSPRRTDD